IRPVAEQVSRDGTTDKGAEEEEDDEAEADDRELVAPESDEDERPITTGLDRFRLGNRAFLNLERRRSVDPYGHDRGEVISKQTPLPPIRRSMTRFTTDC